MRSSLRRINQRNPVCDYRRAWELIRRDGQTVNRKQVHRLWKQEQLSLVARKLRKRVRNDHPLPLCAAYPGHVWTYDFLFDRTKYGHPLKIWTVVDEFTKETLAIRVGRCLKASTVVETLAGLFAHREAPQYLRSDNDLEFLAAIVQSLLVQENVHTRTTAPGCPWQNPYAESFHDKLRVECLNRELFTSVSEAQRIVERWRQEYNSERPHSSLG